MNTRGKNKLARRIGRRISEIRDRRGMTREQLAWETGISKGYLSDIENGKKLPSLLMLEKIARSLGAEMSELF